MTIKPAYLNKRLVFTAISSLLSFLLLLYVYKGFTGNNQSQAIYIIVNSQIIANFLIIFFFYGLQFEVSVKKSISSAHFMWFSLIIFTLVPTFGLALLIFVRIALQKFGRPNQDSLTFCFGCSIAAITIITLILYYHFPLGLILFLFLIPIYPMLIAGETKFDVPDIFNIKLIQLKNSFLRIFLDFSLLLPPLLLNIIIYRYFSEQTYFEIQQLLYCFVGQSLINTLMEKIAFEVHLKNMYSKKKWLVDGLMLMLGYFFVIFLALFLNVNMGVFWWFLLISPTISFFFTKRLAFIRNLIKYNECIIIGLVWLVGFAVSIILLLLVKNFYNDNSLQVIGVILLLSIYQLITLYTFKFGYKIKNI